MTEIIGLIGVTFSVVAVWMQWNLQYRLSYYEERHKDGRITTAQMERGMRWSRLAPILFTLVGAFFMMVAASRIF